MSRRHLITRASWATPVLLATVAAPLAAASVTNFTAAWTGSSTSLRTFPILDSGGAITSQALVTVPTQFTLSGGSGTHPATVGITIGRPPGINPPVGRARGFGISTYDGVATPSTSRTATYQSAQIIGEYGLPLTSYTTSTSFTFGSDGSATVPIALGLAGTSTGIIISQLAAFPVTLTISMGGQTRTATTAAYVPVGAGIL